MIAKRPIFFVVETGSQAGGVKVIGELANRLALRGWTVSIWSVNLRETMTSWFPLNPTVKWVSFFKTGTVSDYVTLANVLKKQSGIKVATFWRTCFATADSLNDDDLGTYLVQDIESSYASQRILIDTILSTYQMPLVKFTTSKWVQSKLLDCQYVGIGLENHWRPNLKLRRGNTVLACARILALKGWDFLCEVARYLDTANIKIITYGHNDKLPMFTKTEHHKFPGDNALRRMYQEAGVFISTSMHEGFNLPLLEAMSCATPCVTTNSDGNMEYVQPGVNCVLENDPYEFARACAGILKDQDLGRRLGNEAVKARESYSWNSVLDRIERIFLADPAQVLPSPNLDSADDIKQTVDISEKVV